MLILCTFVMIYLARGGLLDPNRPAIHYHVHIHGGRKFYIGTGRLIGGRPVRLTWRDNKM